MNVNSENEALRLIEDVPIPAYMDDAYLMFDNSIVRQATNFEEAVNAGPFPVSATGLSYQQVNWLTKDGLLGASEKAGERGWRKFQFREIVYLRISNESQQWPYEVDNNSYDAIKVDASYWDGTSEKSKLENYTPDRKSVV